MKKFITLSLCLCFCFCFCTPISTTPAPVASPTPVVQDTDLCPAADANLQKLACIPVGKPYTLKGKSFTEFCQETQSAGIFINPKCLMQITSCSQEDACNNPSAVGN